MKGIPNINDLDRSDTDSPIPFRYRFYKNLVNPYKKPIAKSIQTPMMIYDDEINDEMHYNICPKQKFGKR